MNFINKLNESNEINLYIFMYVLSFGLVLLNLNFIYWDDWTLVNQAKDDLLKIFVGAGNPFVGYFHYFMIEKLGIYAYKLLIFMSYLISGILLNKILINIKQIYITERIIIVSTFLLFPLNFARIAIIDSPYALNNMTFFMGFYIFSLYLNNNKIIYRIIALLLFFFSFQTNSFLVFYLVVFMYFIYNVKPKNLKEYLKQSILYIDFWLLPFLFYVFKILYLVPQGSHISYYAITQAKIISSFNNFWVFERFMKELLELFPINVSIVSFSIILIGLSILYNKYLIKIFILKNEIFVFKSISFIILGGFFLYIGIFPYLVVNTSPSYYDWESRHMLLLPLGVSFVLLGFINLLYNSKLKYLIFMILISSFISFNITIYFNYLKDGLKQDSILQNIKYNDIIKNNTTFIIFDKTKEYDSLKRTYRFYEYAGMIDAVYSGQTKFATLNTRIIEKQTLAKYLSTDLKLKNYKIHDNYIKLIIQKGSLNLTIINVIKLMYYKITNTNQYNNRVINIINIK
jgi:hypothetical protein